MIAQEQDADLGNSGRPGMPGGVALRCRGTTARRWTAGREHRQGRPAASGTGPGGREYYR
jgi:hypothetical protein